MPEDQNIEWKEIWQDKYLEEICGLANADGGKLYVGINDKGEVVGLDNSKKWTEYIPDKISTMLNIFVDVNLYSEDDKDYIEIVVHPSSSKISYKGVYFYRVGSTNRQLSGAALTDFLKSPEERWENGVVDKISVADLNGESLRIFRNEAKRSKRLSDENLNLTNEELLESLNLMKDGKLKRSAILLFYDHPQILGSGISVRIGRFENGEVIYHEALEGSLILTAYSIVDIIYVKFLKARITYENDRRVETYPYDREAIREAIFNALIHNCYESGIHIQIRIEEDRIVIANNCALPSDWTTETFLNYHKSMPHNPDIANVFYRAGFIENWGQGVQKICRRCREFGVEMPRYEIIGDSISVFITALKGALIGVPTASQASEGKKVENEIDASRHQDSDSDSKTDRTVSKGGSSDTMSQGIVEQIKLNPGVTREELSERFGVTVRQIQRKLNGLKESGCIVRKGGRQRGYWEIVDRSRRC